MQEIIVVPGRSDVFDGIKGQSKLFFDAVIRYMQVRQPRYAMICGGPTSRDHPGMSEARVIYDYFVENSPPVTVGLLEEPLTTNEIFRAVKAKLDEQGEEWSVTQVTIFHEAPSWLKVRLLVWIILRPWGKFRTKVKPVWLGSPRKVWFWQLTVGMSDVVFALIPPLERLERRLRLRQIASGK